MKSQENTEVLIVGAGPTGLMMACQLALHKINFRIIDKKEGPVNYSGALIVQARSIEILNQMGIAQEAIEQGVVVNRINAVLKGRKVMSLKVKYIGKGLTKFPFILMLEQSKTERLLSEFLIKKNISVERNIELQGFVQDQEGVTTILRFQDGNEKVIRSKYLVAADGGHSTVRHQLNIQFFGKEHRFPLFVLDCIAETGLPRDEICFSFSDKSIAGFFPLKNGMWRIDGTVLPELETKEPVTFDDINEKFSEQIRMNVKLVNPSWFTVFHTHERYASSFIQDRCFLAGDAAHIHSPVGAQGMNTGMQDAYNLAWKLALVLRKKANKSILQTYADERFTVAQKLLKTTDLIFTWVTSRYYDSKLFRSLVLPFILHFLIPFLEKQRIFRRYFFKIISQTGICYRKGIFTNNASLGKFPSHAPNPGERLPYILFKENGLNVNLHEKLKAYDFTLFVFHKGLDRGEPAAAIEKIKDIVSIERFLFSRDNQKLFKRFGIRKSGYYLIRPDMHVAYRCNLENVSHFENYLGQFLNL